MPEFDETRSRQLNWLHEVSTALGQVHSEQHPEAAIQMHPIRLLLDFYKELAKWNPKDPAEVQLLRDRVRSDAVIQELSNEMARNFITGYISETEDLVDRGRHEGYRAACEHRSAIQLLIDDFAEHEPLSSIDSTWLTEVDEELSEVAEDAPPLHRGEIPSWAPTTHWWWSAPKRTGMSMREYRERVFGGSLDDDGSTPGTADWLRCGDERCWCATTRS
ncbi:hypothetical protein [Actinomadura sp. CNU-125]|uniref:hypothetical protein n=1 Tax=Actinomadura sp. CNU-125 TaxID=1904961 RepID=UPI001177529F|nr:hypothetical protein [Actinomadura sp. CNU-125]